MIIKSITIKNFRCIRELSIELSDLTAFVGRNGSGKSTILQALGVFYNVKASLSEHDFFNGDCTSPIEITVVYGELNTLEQAEFSAYANNDSFAVTKRIALNEGKTEQRYYASTKQIPALADVRGQNGVTRQRSAWNDLVEKDELPAIGPRWSRSSADVESLMKAYEEQHPDLTEWMTQEVQFFGPPNIGGGKLDNFTKFVYVPAVRDASEDSSDKKGSSLFQLLDFIVLRRFRNRQDVRALQSEFSTRLKELYDPAKLGEFNELATQISNTLKIYVPNAELGLQLAEPALPEIPSPATIAQLVEDDYAGAIDKKGHGLQRALIFSLLQHLAVAKPYEEADGEVNNGSIDAGDTTSQENANQEGPVETESVGPDLIIAIEEPELYQHPLRARHLSRILLQMSREKSMGPGGRNQIVYTTHSPYFVDLERFNQLRMIRKFKQASTEPPCTSAISYSLQNAAEKMEQLTGNTAGQFTAQSFRARAYPVMTQSVNEGFFADKVVLVEGDTEVAALLTVAHRIGHDWLSKGIAVVPVGGKTKIDRAAVIFSGLQIPTYILFDGDCRHKGKKEEANEKLKNRLLLKLCDADEVDFPPATASTKHACFDDDFETYCRQIIGQADYERFREEAGQKHGFDKPTDGIKNFDVVVDLVNTVYENGHKLTLLEEIIEKVNCLGTDISPVTITGDAEAQPEIKIAA